MDLENRIMQEIKKGSVRPRPRWLFVLGDLGRGAEAVLWTAVGALSVALATLLLFEGRIMGSLFIIGIWAAILLVGIFREYRDMVGMRNFAIYRFGALPLAAFLFLVNGALGFTVFQTGQAEKLDQQLEKIPAYQALKAVPERMEPASPVAAPVPDVRTEKEDRKEDSEEQEGEEEDREEDGEKRDESEKKDGRIREDDSDEDDEGEVKGASDRKSGSSDKEREEKRREEPRPTEDKEEDGGSDDFDDEESEEEDDTEGEKREN